MKKNQYKDGKKYGFWEWYNHNGYLMYKGYHKDGEADGYWEFYLANYIANVNSKKVTKEFYL